MNKRVSNPKNRFVSLLTGDVRFQARYGFYFLYAFVTFVYMLIIRALPVQIRAKAASILVFSDPSALGLLFMGAIVLLEKSERTINAIAVSPVRPVEYALSKALSLSLISSLSAVLIAACAEQADFAGLVRLAGTLAGVFAGSVFFSLCGVCLASLSRSLNQFLLFTIPVMLFFMLPPIAALFGCNLMLFRFHAGILVFSLIAGTSANLPVDFGLLLVWEAAAAILACRCATRLFKTAGGITL